MGAVGFELFRQTFVLIHRSHLLVAFRHSTDEGDLADVTSKGEQSCKHG
jgi:hypothetical protein